MTQVHDKPLSPSKAVDEIWHQHILHTQKYHHDCQNAFGTYLHHFPTPASWGVSAAPSKTASAFCCNHADCCNDDPRTSVVGKGKIQPANCVPIGGDSTGANCSGTTNCGNGHPTDCSRLKPATTDQFIASCAKSGTMVDDRGQIKSECVPAECTTVNLIVP